MIKKLTIIYLLSFFIPSLQAENGHRLWLRYQNPKPVKIVCAKESETLRLAERELREGWQGRPGAEVVLKVKQNSSIKGDGFMIDTAGVNAVSDFS